MIKAIVNADDFGISEDVNDAILACFKDEIISGTTLMVNMPFAHEAVSMAGDKGFIDRVGIHLNFTAGTPITGGIKSLPVFCNTNGKFNARFHLSNKTRLFLGKKERQAVRDEARAQIERYLAFGLTQKHLDSHHHVHTDLSIWNEIEPLVKEYGFKSVRLSRNVFPNGECGRFNKIYKTYYNSRLNKNFSELTEYFGSYLDYSENDMAAMDESLIEIMLHPMYSEDGTLMDTNTNMDVVKSFILKNNMTLCSY